MVTIKALNDLFNNLKQDLIKLGIDPKKMILFGSYAKGIPRQDSDIDIAIISDDLTGSRSKDIEIVKSLTRKYPGVEMHFIAGNDNPDANPFLNEI